MGKGGPGCLQRKGYVCQIQRWLLAKRIGQIIGVGTEAWLRFGRPRNQLGRTGSNGLIRGRFGNGRPVFFQHHMDVGAAHPKRTDSCPADGFRGPLRQGCVYKKWTVRKINNRVGGLET